MSCVFCFCFQTIAHLVATAAAAAAAPLLQKSGLSLKESQDFNEDMAELLDAIWKLDLLPDTQEKNGQPDQLR